MAGKADAGPLRALNEDVLIALALVGLVYVVGDRIPLPGLAPEFAEAAGDMARSASLGSVLALGSGPILSVLMAFEASKLLVPRFARWTADPAGRIVHPRTAVAALVIVTAGYQAIGLGQIFVETDALGRDDLSVHLVVATLVAGAATLLFLAERMRVPGLAFGGVWLVVSIPGMEALVFAIVYLNEQVWIGAVHGSELAILTGLFAAAVAGVVFSSAALRERVGASRGDPVRWSPLLVWPPILAGSLANIAAGLAEGLLPTDGNPFSPRFSVVWALCVGVILPVVFVLYVESIERLSSQAPVWRGRRIVLILVAAVQIAICAGFQLLSAVSPATYPIDGPTLIVVVVVFSAAFSPGRLARAGRRQRSTT